MSIDNWRARIAIFSTVASANLKQRGPIWAVRGLSRRIGVEILWVLLMPVSLTGHLLGYRRLNVRVEHIGHLAAEPDSLLKDLRLGVVTKMRWLLLAPSRRVANPHLLEYWSQHFTVITSPWICHVISAMSRHWIMKQDVQHYVGRFFGAQEIYRVNSMWGEMAPILSLSPEDESWGSEALDLLGIPEGKWFVAVHVREGGFLPGNEIIQSHRNAAVSNVIPAMQEIVRQGGVCVRMGDCSMTPLPSMPGIIDYAHHPMKSDRLDVVLCAKARFFLGCTSGLAFLSTTFGVPVAHANMIPVETLGIRYCDLSIPKLLWSKRLGRHLSFKEVFESEIGGYFFTQQYVSAGITIEENTADDIQELAVEMLDRLAGFVVHNEGDRKLHDRYMTFFKPNHYSWGAVSSVGIAFLRRHKQLLE